MRTFRSLALVAVCALGGLCDAGCSNDRSPTSQQYDDVAQATAAIVVPSGGGGETGSIADTASLSVGVSPGNVTASTSGSFSGVAAGLTYDFTVQCTGTGGAMLPACGPTTDNAMATVSWSGNLTLPSLSATVNRNGDWTLTGLQTGTATFNGTGSLTFNGQFSSAFYDAQATANLSYDATYDNVAYDLTTHQVTGGSASYTIHAAGSESSAYGSSSTDFEIGAVLTFGAGGSATLTLDGTYKYAISTTGSVVKI